MRVVLESRACEKIHNLNFDPVGRRLRSVLGNREGSFVALVGLGSDPWLASPNISAQPQRGARRISDFDDRLNRYSHDSCRIASEAPRGFLRHCRNILIIVRLLYPTHYSCGVSLAWSFTRVNPQHMPRLRLAPFRAHPRFRAAVAELLVVWHRSRTLFSPTNPSNEITDPHASIFRPFCPAHIGAGTCQTYGS